MRSRDRGGDDVRESEDNASLAGALRAMAGEDARIGASPAVEAIAIAAVVLLALAVPGWRMLTRLPSAARVEEVTTDFLPLLYSSVPASHVQMVRLAVPRAALASFGLMPLESLDRASTDTVMADVLVGDDGLARAVRFVRPAADQEHMP
jgi:hypothetical protein